MASYSPPPNSNPYKIYIKCGGRRNKFTDNDKLVIQHQEYHSFTSPKTGSQTQDLANSRYTGHCKMRNAEYKIWNTE